jgi:hypothetical protein
MNENYNILAERSVLNSLLFAPEKFSEYKKELEVNIFYLPTHRDIYEAMLELNKQDKPLDEELIKRVLLKKGKFNEEVMLLVLSVAPHNYIMNYITELQELHRHREVYDATLHFQGGKIDLQKLNSIIASAKNMYVKEEVQKASIQEYKHITPFMKSLLAELKSINDYPDSMVWSVMLPSMAGLIGARAKITNGINLTVPPVIWSMIVAPSSLAAKSTLYRITKDCIFGDMQKEFYNEYEEKKKNYKTLHKGYLALPKEEKLQEDEPEPPTLEQIVFHAGGTPEAKIKSLEHNPNGGVVYFDEMKAELELTNANQAYKALKTSIFDGETYHKELVNGGTIILHSPILSEVGLITKPWLLDVAQKNDVASGFMARYLFSVNSRHDFKPLQINSTFHIDTKRYSKVGEFIINMFNDCEDAVIFKLSDKARHKHTEWFNEYSKTVYDTETDEEATASYRLSTYVLKFMLISYIFNNANNLIDVIASDNMLTIGDEYFDEALEIMELFRNESHKLLQLFENSDKLNFKLDDIAVKVHRKIDRSKHKKITRSEANNIRGINKEKIDYLISTGMIISQKLERTEYLSKP